MSNVSKNFIETNDALSKLFVIASKSMTLNEMLDKSLDVLLNVSWLSVLPKGGIFLTNTDNHGNTYLKLASSKNLGCIKDMCNTVSMGHCLCGRAALSKKPVHASCLDVRHETMFDGIQPHGHYNIPILLDKDLIGVLVFYLPDGTKKDNEQIGFLMRAAGVLSLAISLKIKEEELLNKNRELEFQKLTLDEHAIVSIADINGNIIYVNDKFCEISGYSKEEVIGENHNVLKSNYQKEYFYKNLWDTISKGKIWHGEVKNKSKNGNFYWVNETISPFLDNKGIPFKYVSISTDITTKKNMEFELLEAQKVANMGSWNFVKGVSYLKCSREFFNIYGIIYKDSNNIEISLLLKCIYEEDFQKVKSKRIRSIKQRKGYDIEYRIINQSTGEVRWIHEKCLAQYNSDNILIKANGTIQDITKIKIKQFKIEDLAMNDSLTGLANRYSFDIKISSLLRKTNKKFALILLDLDDFKNINDDFGHIIGDKLLKKVSKIFKSSCRETDMVARIGGDEFAILSECNSDNLDNYFRISSAIQNKIKELKKISELDINIGISIGAAIFPDHGEDKSELINNADIALYKAKKLGKNCCELFKYNN